MKIQATLVIVVVLIISLTIYHFSQANSLIRTEYTVIAGKYSYEEITSSIQIGDSGTSIPIKTTRYAVYFENEEEIKVSLKVWRKCMPGMNVKIEYWKQGWFTTPRLIFL